MYYVWVTLFAVGLIAGWALTLFGLPGNWILVGSAAAFAYFFPVEGAHGLSWTLVAVLAGLALLGEILEFIAGAAGVARGGSKRGAFLAVIGSFIGSLVGAVVGIPIPVIGSFVAILIFSSIGAMAGAIAGEMWKGKDSYQTLKIGEAAFWGRLFGSLSKIIVGSIILTVAIAGALIP